MFLVVPAWLLAGFADYVCHRSSRIEATSGPKESMLHIAQFLEAGVPLLAVLFLEVDGYVILLMLVCLGLHQATAVWDVRYANATRVVGPAEQHIHGVLEMVPFFAVLIVGIMHWNAVLSLLDGSRLEFAPRLKQSPLPTWYLVSVLVAVALLAIVPYAEELLRTLGVAKRALKSTP